MFTVVIERPTNDSFKFDCKTLDEAKKEAKECLKEEGRATTAKIMTDDGIVARYKKTPDRISNLYVGF